MNIATAYVEIRADTAAGRREAVAGAKEMAGEASAAADAGNKVQVKSAQNAGEKIRAEQDKTVKKAKSAAQQITEFIAGAAFLKAVNSTVEAASRQQQAIGATEAVFKSYSSTIDDFASTSAKSWGISNAGARELTAQIGSLLKGFGFSEQAAADQSVVLAKLGADLSATFGGKPEEAVQALGAALRGEFNPLERFGVSLNVAQANLKAVELGLASSTSQVSLQARAQAALAIIMERTTDAQGQFGREAETYAGQQARATAAAEDAKAKFGEQLLPVMTRVQQVLGFLAEGFGDLPGPIQLSAVGLLGFVALAGPVQTLTGNVKGLITSMKAMSTAGVAASAAAAGIAAAVVIGYLAYQSFTSKQREVTARSKDVASALGEATDAALANADAANGAAIANSALSAALADTGVDGEKLTKALGTLGFTTQDTIDILSGLGGVARDDTLRSLAESAGYTGEAVEALLTIINSAGDGRNLELKAKSWSDALGLPREQFLAVAQAMEELDDQREKFDLDSTLRGFIAETAALNDVNAALVTQAELNVTRKRTGEDLLPLYEEINRLAAEQGVVLTDTADAADGAAGAIGGLGDETEETARKTSELTEASGPLTNIFDALDQAASDLAGALDRVFGRYVSLEEANRGLAAAGDELAKSLTDNGNTLDINTEAGRANREEIQKGISAIDTWAEAWVASGKPTEDAVAGVNLFTEGLRQQLLEAGVAEEAVDEYLTTLGRTPENVETTVALLGEEQQARLIEEYKDQLEEIPEDVFTEIEAALADGDLAEAERLLQQFTSRQRFINIGVHVTGGGMIADSSLRNALEGRGNATGAYSNKAQISLWGEDGAEWVAPLTKPDLMEKWLTDPRIRGPVVAGLSAGGPGTMRGMVAMANGGLVGSSRASSFGTAITTVFGSAGDAEAATRGLLAAVQELGEALEESGGDLGANLDLVDAQRDAIFEWAEAQIAAGRSTQDVAADVKNWIQELRGNVTQLGVNEAEIDDYLNRIGLIPSNVDTVIELVGAEEAKRQLEEHQRELEEVARLAEEARRAIEDYGNGVVDALGRAAAAVRRQRDELLGLWGTSTNLEQARSRVEAGADDLADPLRRGRTLDVGTERGRSARSALTSQLDAVFALARGQLDAGASLSTVQSTVNQELARIRDVATRSGVDSSTLENFLRQVGRSGSDFAVALRALEGSSRQLDQLGDVSNRLDSALDSGDAAAINDAARAGERLSIQFVVEGNIYGDQALQRALDNFERRIADALRSR